MRREPSPTNALVVRPDDPMSAVVFGDVRTDIALYKFGRAPVARAMPMTSSAWNRAVRRNDAFDDDDGDVDESSPRAPPAKMPRIEVCARGESRRQSAADATTTDGDETEEDATITAATVDRGAETDEDPELAAIANLGKRRDDDDDGPLAHSTCVVPSKNKKRSEKNKGVCRMDEIATSSEKPNRRRFATAVNVAPEISQVPACADAIMRLRLAPTDPDSKVPPPEKCKSEGMISYAYFLYDPKHPPHPEFPVWPEYRDWVSALVYRSPAWGREHGKYMTASLAASALGLSTRESVQKAWYRLRYPSSIEKDDLYDLRIKESGVQEELLHRELYAYMLHGSAKLVSECGSQIHATETWIMFTPDGKVYSNDGSEHIRDVEYKTPVKRAVYLEVPDEYMPQLQIVMQGDGVDEDDFCSMRVDEATGYCRWVAIRVHRCDEYWARAYDVLCEFARAVLTGSKPPPKGTFDPPHVKTEMIVRLEDALDLIPNGREKLANLLAETENRALNTQSEIRERNKIARDEQIAADVRNSAAAEARFDMA